jgi:hypothetical protein
MEALKHVKLYRAGFHDAAGAVFSWTTASNSSRTARTRIASRNVA